jgi:hypothetical protein
MTLSIVDCARFMVHDWGTIFEFFPLVPNQILVWVEHVVNLIVIEVNVTKLQRCDLILVYAHYTYPFWEVRSDQSVLKFSRHTVTIDFATQRW